MTIPDDEQFAAASMGFRGLWALAEKYSPVGEPSNIKLITITKEQLTAYFRQHPERARNLLYSDVGATHDVEAFDFHRGLYRVYWIMDGKPEAMRTFSELESAAAEWVLSKRWGIAQESEHSNER